MGLVLRLPSDIYAAVLCALLVGGLSTFEVWWPLRDLDHLTDYSKRSLSASFGWLVLYGGFAYFLFWTAVTVGAIKIASQDFWPWKAVVAAVFSQALRLEVAGKAPLEGPHGLRAGLESYYGRLLRARRSRIYLRLLDKHPRNERLGDLVSVGLPKAYTLDDTKLRFERWLNEHCSTANRHPQCNYMDQVKEKASKGQTDLVKSGILWAGLAHADLERAVDYACQRASAIVDLEAFR